jgi:short-subunit dehydrogenase
VGAVTLAGRTVLLTGATGGLGATLARTFAARGAALVLTGRRADALAALAAETGGRPIVADLAEASAPETLVREAGAIDILVANAGLPASGRLDSFSVEEIDRALMTNLRAPIVLARLLGEPMAARGEGHIVFMSSLSGKAASVGTSVYSATKFGLRGFAQGLREDLGPSGVGVSCVFPGFVRDAGMLADTGATLPRYVGTSTAAQVAEAVLRAIEANRAEVDVAPFAIRVGAMAAGLAPALSARVQRRLGGAAMSTAITDAQRDKR